MHAHCIRFGEIEIDGTLYAQDVVIDRGTTGAHGRLPITDEVHSTAKTAG